MLQSNETQQLFTLVEASARQRHHRLDPARGSGACNLTQAQMAPLMGMSLSGYRKWKQGTRRVSGLGATLLRVIERSKGNRRPSSVHCCLRAKYDALVGTFRRKPGKRIHRAGIRQVVERRHGIPPSFELDGTFNDLGVRQVTWGQPPCAGGAPASSG